MSVYHFGSLGEQLKELTGLTFRNSENPLVQDLISAERNYNSGRMVVAYAGAARINFMIEDLKIILGHDVNLWKHFRRELHRKSLPQNNYFGLRLEIRMAASLITSKLSFCKSETPDFKLSGGFNDIGIECTSSHVNLNSDKYPEQVIYKVESAIIKKAGYNYHTSLNILAMDVSNLIFHEGQRECVALLTDKDKSIPLLKKRLKETPFSSLVYFYYSWQTLQKCRGVTMHYFYSRIDREVLDSKCKRFLDLKYPYGDRWVYGNVSKLV